LLRRAQAANEDVQACFRKRAAKRLVLPAEGVFMNQYEVPCLKYFNRVLDSNASISTEQSLKENVEILERIARHIEDMLGSNATIKISDDERDLFGDYRLAVLA
jgi:hypothetical protein